MNPDMAMKENGSVEPGASVEHYVPENGNVPEEPGTPGEQFVPVNAEVPEEPGMTEEQLAPENGDVPSDMHYNEIKRDEFLHNALSEAAVIRQSIAKDNIDNNAADSIDIPETDVSELEMSETLESELADNINAELQKDDSANAGPGSEAGTDKSDGIMTIDIEEEPKPELSKYGVQFNYITEKELYEKLSRGVTAPANFAVALYKNDNAEKITWEISNYIGTRGFIKKPMVAKINSGKLNSINLAEKVHEIKGTCLIIENAANMTSKTVNGVIKVIDSNPSDIVMIFVDREEELSRFLLKEAVLSNQISNFVIY
jgi:hypothetical protein